LPYWVEGGLALAGDQVPFRQGKSIRNEFRQRLVADRLETEGIKVQNGLVQPTVFPLYTSSAAEREVISEDALIWQGRMYMALGRMEPIWRISTSKGATVWEEGIRVRVLEKNVSDDTSVHVRFRIPAVISFSYDRIDSSFPLTSHSSPIVYAIVNRRTKQAVMSDGYGDAFTASAMIFTEATIHIPRLRMEDGHPMPLAEWTQWVEEAELVAFRFVEESRGYVEVSAPLGLGGMN
jgi:hypothetical protein